MVSKDKLMHLVLSSLEASSLTKIDTAINPILERMSDSFEKLITYPDWDVRDDTRAEIDFFKEACHG